MPPRSDTPAVKFNRRQILLGTTLGIAGSLMGLRASAIPDDSQELPPLTANDPLAKALSYHADARKVDVNQFPEYDPAQRCATCVHLKAGTGEERGCDLIPGKAVNVNGWCQVWTPQS